MPNRHVDASDAFQEWAFPWRGLEIDPAVLVAAGIVVGQSGQRAIFIRLHQQSGLQHRLKAVADSEHQLLAVVVAEAAQGVLRKCCMYSAWTFPAPMSSPY